MFLQNILNEDLYNEVLDNYDYDYLESLDYDIFTKNYILFKNKKFYFIEELIIKYLDIFMLDSDIIESALYEIEKVYGTDYILFIGHNLDILEKAIVKVMER